MRRAAAGRQLAGGVIRGTKIECTCDADVT